MTVLASGIALYALLNLALPGFRGPFVQNIYALSPSAISLHLVGGAVAMIAGALQLNARLRSSLIAVHRWLGRVYVLAVLVGGLAGMVLAVNSYGGLTTHFGFGLMAICWIAATMAAYWNIRKGDLLAHRNWMIRSYALTLAGVTLRIYLGGSVLAGIRFADIYPALSWLCWVPNLLLVEWFVLAPSSQPKTASAIDQP